MLREEIEPISIEGTEKILNLCKIYNKSNGRKETGFFCKIPYKKEILPVLITNNHVINENDIFEKKEIYIFINDDIEVLKLRLDYNKRKIYTNEKYDVTIIEIKQCYDHHLHNNNFLELDEILLNRDNDVYYIKPSIYMIGYPKREKGQEAMVSYGIIQNIEDQEIRHSCSSNVGNSGSPLLNIYTNKVIGIHYENRFNKGTFLKYPINEFNNDINIIREFKNYKDEDFTNLKLISSGRFGEVYSAHNIKEEKELCL